MKTMNLKGRNESSKNCRVFGGGVKEGSCESGGEAPG